MFMRFHSAQLCLCHCVSVYQIGYSTGQSWVRENQVRDLAELSAFPGYADTVSVDPNLHVVAHPKVGENQLGFPADLGIPRRNPENRQSELALIVHRKPQVVIPMKSRNEVVALVRAKIRLRRRTSALSLAPRLPATRGACRRLPTGARWGHHASHAPPWVRDAFSGELGGASDSDGPCLDRNHGGLQTSSSGRREQPARRSRPLTDQA